MKYSPEFRAQALERLKGCVNVSALARELGISRKWLYLWRDRKPVPADPRSKGERERDRLRKRVAELERLSGQQAAQIDFFKGALRRVEERRPRNDASGGAASNEQIEVMQSQGVLTIEQMCRAGGVSRAGFYRDWEQKAPDQAAMALRDAIQRASLEHPRYGGAKVVEVLRRAGWVVSLSRVQRVRRDDNLLAVRRRKFVVTTDSDHEFLVYPNLAQYMVLSAVNQLWVADITYLRLASEFAYFAVVLDAFSRRALGWAVGPSLQAALPLKALNRAIATRAPGPGLVHHSDRGTQYACNDYVRRLEECQITISMSRPARPWENARCERFMRTLKEEEIDCREYATLAELERNLEDFVERFYNRVRLHAALGYLSPVEFEQEQHSGVATPPPVAGIIAALSFRRHQEIYPDGVQNRRAGRRRK